MGTWNVGAAKSARPWRRPRLRVVGGESGPLGPPDDGSPHILGRCDGWPLELRVWRRRPDEPDAVWHPSGVWVSVRVR